MVIVGRGMGYSDGEIQIHDEAKNDQKNDERRRDRFDDLKNDERKR